MAQKIRVYRWGKLTEVEPEEAKRIVEDCCKQNNIIVVETKTQKVIREIGPDVKEITIFSLAGGG